MVTIINCHQPRTGPPQADFIDPATGRQITIPLANEQAAWTLADRLTASGKWAVFPSLSAGLWRACRLSLLDRNCPGWQEQAEQNAGANRR